MGNSLCHWEFMVHDVETSKAFYGKVFDWSFDDQSYPGYTLIHTGKEPSGGMMAKPAEAPMPCLSQYFQVDSVDGTMAKVTAGGGRVIVPKMEIPKVGWFAMFTDPDGIPVGILEPQTGP